MNIILLKKQFTFIRAYDYDGVYSLEGVIDYNTGKMIFYVTPATNPTKSYSLELNLPYKPTFPMLFIALSYTDQNLKVNQQQIM